MRMNEPAASRNARTGGAFLLAAALAFCLRNAQAQTAHAAAEAKAPAASAAPASTEPTVQDLFPAEKYHLRDPFLASGGGSSGFQGGGELTEFSIHNLLLKGIMQDRSGDFALFVDANSGSDYVLRKNILYDNKNKPVRGVSGIIKPQQKRVHLLTSDQDVQTFVLGEERGPE